METQQQDLTDLVREDEETYEEQPQKDPPSKVVEGYEIRDDLDIPNVRRQRTQVWEKLAKSMNVGEYIRFDDKKEAKCFTSFLSKNQIPYTSRTRDDKVYVWKLRKNSTKGGS